MTRDQPGERSRLAAQPLIVQSRHEWIETKSPASGRKQAWRGPVALVSYGP